MARTSLIIHAVLFAIAVIAYMVLTITGHDGNPILVFFAGQATSAAITTATNTPK